MCGKDRAASGPGKTKASEALKVVARCRPSSRKEEAAGHEQILTMDVKLGQVTLRNPRCPQRSCPRPSPLMPCMIPARSRADLYDETVRPLVDSVLQGFNSTVFAYGQTGTGKTYTMQGPGWSPSSAGVIPNAFEHIFTHISRSQNQQYLVRASCLEIYQGEIRDLLSETQQKAGAEGEPLRQSVYIETCPPSSQECQGDRARDEPREPDPRRWAAHTHE